MDVRAYLAERSPVVDRWLDDFLPPADEPPTLLHQAARHLLFPGGKRFRPALAMAAAEAVGASSRVALPAAAAVELLHTYSLIHDDLPCMDDDDERRGVPTVHVKYGEAVAVLAGDALHSKAFEAVVTAMPEAGAERTALVVRDLAVAVGSRGLAGGQVDDVAPEADAFDVARIESVHERKTAALIAGAVTAGARLAGASEQELVQLHSFGRDMGLAFQIADDRLDEGEDGGCSLVYALGREAACERAEALLAAALSRIAGWGERAEPLRELARFAVRRPR